MTKLLFPHFMKWHVNVVAGLLFLSTSDLAAQQPSIEMCRQKLIAIQLQGEAEKNASRGNDLAQTQALYKANQGQKELFEGECSNHPQARNFANSGRESMREYGAFCQRLGSGSDCGVGPGQGSSAGNAAGNPPGRSGSSSDVRSAQGPSEDSVSACIAIEYRSSAISTQSMVNKCSHPIELTWCFEGGSAADSCDNGYKNLWTLGPGAAYPIQGPNVTRARYGACKGKNTLRNLGGFNFQCTPP